jgi:hypothetical protein
MSNGLPLPLCAVTWLNVTGPDEFAMIAGRASLSLNAVKLPQVSEPNISALQQPEDSVALFTVTSPLGRVSPSAQSLS